LQTFKILWDQIVTVFRLMLLGIWSATQWTAASFAHQSQLVEPWYYLYGWPVYEPLAFFEWWFFYDAYAPGIFATGAYIAVSGSFAGVIASVELSVWHARETKIASTSRRRRRTTYWFKSDAWLIVVQIWKP
jgi:type IV secretion system protein VirD4